MKEEKLDILSDEAIKSADAICFTSNGIVKNNGELVMGAGVAKIFRDKWPSLPRQFGCVVKLFGNTVKVLNRQISYERDIWIVSFPTKQHWKDPSNLNLIIKSCKELMLYIGTYDWKRVLLPRPGCSNGGLDWEEEVKPAIENILDDRVVIVYQ